MIRCKLHHSDNLNNIPNEIKFACLCVRASFKCHSSGTASVVMVILLTDLHGGDLAARVTQCNPVSLQAPCSCLYAYSEGDAGQCY